MTADVRRIESKLRRIVAASECRIFRWEDGRRLLPDWVSRRFDQLVEASGLPRITFRNLRDSHATMFYGAGFSAKVLAERLGHWDPGFTMRTYGSAGPTLQRAAIDSLAAKISGG